MSKKSDNKKTTQKKKSTKSAKHIDSSDTATATPGLNDSPVFYSECVVSDHNNGLHQSPKTSGSDVNPELNSPSDLNNNDDQQPNLPQDLAPILPLPHVIPTENNSTNPNVAAFFDVDNTLVQGASLVHYARGLARRNYFGYTELLGFVWHQMKFRLVGKENIQDVDYGKEQALAFIAGRKTNEFMQLGEELYSECIGNKLWPITCQIAKEHMALGRQVWLITATPKELAEMIAYKLELTGAKGTVAEEKNGVFTGRLIGQIMHGQAKADALLEISRENNIDLINSYAYSDSINDLPMLQLVGNPVAVNPDAQLRDYAKNNNWEIHDFRAARKAAKYSVPALLLGAASGSAAAAAVKLARR